MVEKKRPVRSKKSDDLNLFERKNEKKDPMLEVADIDVNLITQNPNQPRKNFNKDKLDELVRSIESNGILEPIIVRPKGEKFEIVVGERRFRAALQLGYTKVPSIIKQGLDDRSGLVMALVENLQRDDLNPLEEANTYNQLITEHKLTQDEMAKLIGKSRVAISNTIRLLKLPDSIKSYVNQGKISEGHARAILSLKTPEHQSELCEKILNAGLSVRGAEEEAHKISSSVSRETARITEKDEHIVEIESSLQEILGLKVSIKMKKKNSRLEILCNSQSDLEKIINKLLSN